MATYAQIYDAQQQGGAFWVATYVAVQKAAQAIRSEAANTPLHVKRNTFAFNATRNTAQATTEIVPLVATLFTDPTTATDVQIQNNVNGVLSIETSLDFLNKA